MIMNHKNYERRIPKDNRNFVKKFLDFKEIKFLVKITDIHKNEKKYISISVFGYENKEKHPIYESKKCCEEKHFNLLSIEEERKKNYALIKYLNTFTYNHTLHCGRKYFCHYCLQNFSTEEILKHQIKDCFKIIRKWRIMMISLVNLLSIN